MPADYQSTLKALGKLAKKEALESAAKEAEAKQKKAENISFAQAVGKVEPLKQTDRYYEKPRDTSPIKLYPQDKAVMEQEDYFYIGTGIYETPPASFSKNGQGKNDLLRLRNGHYPVVADVDLHGYTQEEAQEVLNEFIEFAKKRGVCAEIIHGSGLGSAGYKPVLKNMTRRWLMQHPDVLAYIEPKEGNDGAVRILLKRRRVEDE